MILGLAATPALAQRVTVDYAHDFDFETIKSFQYVETSETDVQDPLMAGRIVEMLKQRLRDGGLEEVEKDPDLYVTYHATTKDRVVLNTSHYGYGGYGGGYYGWGGTMGGSSTQVSTYTDGTLIFDGYEAKEKKVVWRGTGTVTIKAKPEKRIRQVEKILNKIGKRWDRILRNQGK